MSIIPTEVVSNNQIGDIISKYEGKGLRVAGLKLVRLSDQKATEFLAVVRGRENYKNIKESIHSGPVLLVALEGDDAVNKNIEIIGDEQPGENNAEPGKAVYWSENPDVAKMDVEFFFNREELSPRY